MEKAKLWVRETKKKKIHVEIEFANGKRMPFPQLKVQDTVLNGAEIEVEREGGQVILIKGGEQVLYSTKSSHQSIHSNKINDSTQASGISARQRYEHIRQVRNPAYAPYNFVPLNQTVVAINPEIPDANEYDPKRHTGWIELEIKTLTPLYIRGSLTKEEVLAGKESKDNPDFFSPVNSIRIPGSSLRGMIRNLVEIISCGRFHFTEKDKRLYYRGLADRSSLRDEYQRRMSSYDRHQKRSQFKFSAGILRKSKNGKKGEHFEIVSVDGNFKQIFKSEAREKIEATGEEYKEFEFYEVDDGYLVVSGNIPGKKRDWFIYNPPKNAEVFNIDDKDVQNYLGDRNRSKDVPNLIERARKKPEGVPCFYVRWQDEEGNERTSFGHTGFFRLAYEKTIGEHLFAELMDKGKIDFTKSVFGNETDHAGRVFFEDAFLTEQENTPLLEEQIPKTLSEPKPTTFQHYLVQNSDEVRRLNHYNSDTVIRGYKMYWHKSGESWVETDKNAIEKHSTQYTRIQPVKAGTKFKGKIRFENLSDSELGALLFALDLPEGCAYKLGMGKPLGLGSVKIKPRLFLSNRQNRYRDFFSEWNNNIHPEDNAAIKKIKREFEQYILEKLGEPVDRSLWETERLKELLVMLNVGIGRELEKDRKSRYMTISGLNEFKNRRVLPHPSYFVTPEKIASAISKEKNKHIVKEELKGETKEKRPTYLKKIIIKGLWNKFDFEWKLDQKVNILLGINGSGKTTILELIKDALKGEYQKSRYVPNEFILYFDRKCFSHYKQRKLISGEIFRIPTEFVSTFDEDIGDGETNGTMKEAIERQLSADLLEKLGDLFREIKSLPETINIEIFLEILKKITKEVFKRTKKQIDFKGEFIITEDTLKKLIDNEKIPENDIENISKMLVKFQLRKSWEKELKNQNIPVEIVTSLKKFQRTNFKSLQEIEIELKKKLGKDQFDNFKGKILNQIEMVGILKPDMSSFGILLNALNGDKDKSRYLHPLVLKYGEYVPQPNIGEFLVLRLGDDRLLVPDMLSSGEKQILIILLSVLLLKIKTLANYEKSGILIMDEPEISLHLEWQEKLIKWIHQIHDKIQIIIATHSPGVMMGGWFDKVTKMERILRS